MNDPQWRQPKAHILVVDDNPGMVRTMALILEHKGYAVTVARDGLEAIERVRERPFSSILMDLKMPCIDGLDAFHQIRQIRPGAQVLIVTAYAVDDQVRRAVDSGVRGVLRKPVDIDRLLEMLDCTIAEQVGTEENRR